MIVSVVAIIFGIIMVMLSVKANARFRREATLPMQWSVSGSVNWSASRVFALSLTPTLAICVLTLFVVGAMNFPPRPGQEDMVIPALIAMGSLFVGIHIFHLWLIDKTLRRNDR